MDIPKARSAPVSLRMALHVDELVGHEWCDDVACLGSYWTRSDDSDLQSLLVKYFKTQSLKPLDMPAMSAITYAYADAIVETARKWQPQAVLRVLSSGETRPETHRPQSLLVNLVARAFDVPDLTDLFFRTEPRKPMRMIDRFSGPDVLRQRVHYVLQDLFALPRQIPQTVLLIDDIYNLGATARAYSAALKKFCGAEAVYSANLAVARFSQGKDGWGRLQLDLDKFLASARQYAAGDESGIFEDVWTLHGRNVFHAQRDCSGITGSPRRSIRLFEQDARVSCPSCAVAPDPRAAVRRLLENLRQPK